MIRSVTAPDSGALIGLVGKSGLFEDDAEIAEIEKRLSLHLAGGDGSLWLVSVDGGLEGVAYALPEPMTRGTWNLLMLLVDEEKKGKGRGAALVEAVLSEVIKRGGRLLVVETSGTDDFAAARSFYAKCGFAEVARIPDFYDDGNDKIVFCKHIE